MLRVLELNRRLIRIAGTVGDVQDALIVEAHMNGPLHQRRRGDAFQFIAIRNGERVRFERSGFCGVCFAMDTKDGKHDENADAIVFAHETQIHS